MVTAPERIVAGPVVLEVLGPEWADEVADAINENLDHLRPWMVWAHRSTTTQEQAMRLAVAGEQARAGGDASYTILDGGRVVGGCGLHRRDGDLEIGYWLVADAEGQGFVTAAAAALARVAFERFDAPTVTITCDEANVRSAAVPRRLGFAHVETRDEDRSAPADTNRTMVWRLARAGWPESPGFAIPVSYA